MYRPMGTRISRLSHQLFDSRPKILTGVLLSTVNMHNALANPIKELRVDIETHPPYGSRENSGDLRGRHGMNKQIC